MLLQRYLPEEMSEDKIREAVEKIAEEAGIDRNMKSMGTLMKTTMAKLKGKADGSAVSKVVKEYLSGK